MNINTKVNDDKKINEIEIAIVIKIKIKLGLDSKQMEINNKQNKNERKWNIIKWNGIDKVKWSEMNYNNMD